MCVKVEVSPVVMFSVYEVQSVHVPHANYLTQRRRIAYSIQTDSFDALNSWADLSDFGIKIPHFKTDFKDIRDNCFGSTNKL